MTILGFLLLSLCISISYWLELNRAIKELPQIVPVDQERKTDLFIEQFPKVSIIVPAYNEAENIEACVEAILLNTALPPEKLEVWVVDDQSSDRTLAILHAFQQQSRDPRLQVISGIPKPEDRVWLGKNWACQQAASKATGDYFIFIDADVRVKPGAITAIVQTAVTRQLDFITCIPQVVSGSLAEWLVQPLMYINVLVSFNSAVVKNPKTKTAYALGPFLLFHAAAYQQLGTHATVSQEVAEDVAFARKVKQQGFSACSILAPNLLSLRMYQTWQALWEGWTKVLYVGAHRSVSMMLLLVFVMLLVYTIPWIGLGLAFVQIVYIPGGLGWAKIGLAAVTILLQYGIRAQGSRALGTQPRYWWLQGVGGCLIASLAIVSIIKAETGWGWTWRGRSLVAARKGIDQ
ncbi:MAG: glycosyltransferase family 2 protein [Leptolyngbyaceae cyanobacterium bins.302]|nr:glycosyltransferase family 2 protein [Leptolyngbyaceae cyanobacterium bins.302]